MGRPPVISPTATSTLFNNKKKFPYFLRTVDDDVAQARAIADLIQHYGWSHVMGLYSVGKNAFYSEWNLLTFSSTHSQISMLQF